MNTHSPFEPGYIGNSDGGDTLVAEPPAPDDQQAAYDALPEADRAALDALSDEDRAALAALTPEDLAALQTQTVNVPSNGVPEEVREGTVQDVLDWVNGDAGRAETALAVEETRDHPRKTLTEPLQALLTPPQAE